MTQGKGTWHSLELKAAPALRQTHFHSRTVFPSMLPTSYQKKCMSTNSQRFRNMRTPIRDHIFPKIVSHRRWSKHACRFGSVLNSDHPAHLHFPMTTMAGCLFWLWNVDLHLRLSRPKFLARYRSIATSYLGEQGAIVFLWRQFNPNTLCNFIL